MILSALFRLILIGIFVDFFLRKEEDDESGGGGGGEGENSDKFWENMSKMRALFALIGLSTVLSPVSLLEFCFRLLAIPAMIISYIKVVNREYV